MRTQFSLEREQRQRLLSGDYRPLLCQTKPAGCEPGATYVLTWSRARRNHAEEIVYEIGRTPSCYLTVTKIVRHQKGGWLIRFEVTDLRSPVRFLRANPPVWVPQGDSTDSGDTTSSEESFYTTSRWSAIDELEVVPQEWQKRFSKTASERDHQLRKDRVDEQQKARWASKRRRRRQRYLESVA